MAVFYYQYEGETFVICTSTANPGRLSPIWNCNTCMWIVPGTFDFNSDFA